MPSWKDSLLWNTDNYLPLEMRKYFDTVAQLAKDGQEESDDRADKRLAALEKIVKPVTKPAPVVDTPVVTPPPAPSPPAPADPAVVKTKASSKKH